MADMVGAEGAGTFSDSINPDMLIPSLATRHNIPLSVQKGMYKQFALQKTWLYQGIGQIETIMHLWGSSATNLVLQCALQHPFSRGTVMVNGTNPWNQPAINPDYFSATADADMMVAAVGFLRNFAKTKPLGDILTQESAPNAGLSGDALLQWVKTEGSTEYHPVGTCAMLPKEDGGVVDTSLKVYGTANVRVVDSSVIPMHISSHTMGTTYGVAEFGADIIKTQNSAAYLNPVSSSSSATSASKTSAASSSSSAASTAAPVEDHAGDDEGLSTGAKAGIGVGAGLGGLALVGGLVSLARSLLATANWQIWFLMRKKGSDEAADKNGWYANGERNQQWTGNGQ